jgi:hypothetical protein
MPFHIAIFFTDRSKLNHANDGINIRFWDNRIWYRRSSHAEEASSKNAIFSPVRALSQAAARSKGQGRLNPNSNSQANTTTAIVRCKMRVGGTSR